MGRGSWEEELRWAGLLTGTPLIGGGRGLAWGKPLTVEGRGPRGAGLRGGRAWGSGIGGVLGVSNRVWGVLEEPMGVPGGLGGSGEIQRSLGQVGGPWGGWGSLGVPRTVWGSPRPFFPLGPLGLSPFWGDSAGCGQRPARRMLGMEGTGGSSREITQGGIGGVPTFIEHPQKWGGGQCLRGTPRTRGGGIA